MLMLIGAGEAWGYEPPRIIGELRGIGDDSLEFAQDFCWAEDQNGDGYDDLLVIHDGQGRVRALKLYYGGQTVDNESDKVITINRASEVMNGLNYLGRLTPDNDHWFVVSTTVREEGWPVAEKLNFFKGGDALDTIPDIVWTMPIDSFYILPVGYASRPVDFNNDGFDDVLTTLFGDSEAPGAQLIFYGGAEFDSIPDWINWIEDKPRLLVWPAFQTGYDVNGDGWIDFLWGTSLFLGGDPMDTVAVWTYRNIESDTAEGDTTDRTLYQFIMFPDVNGDGYDDWGCYWTDLGVRSDDDGYYLFYGSANPDMIPDVDLEGNHEIWSTYGSLCGGDFNNDDFGDIVTMNPFGYAGDGEMHITLGTRWIRSNPDMNIRMISQYADPSGGFSLGAIGDYNGDHLLDFVTHAPYSWPQGGGNSYRRVYIFAGSRYWVVSVSEETPPTRHAYDWTMTTSPNPFNSSLRVTVNGVLAQKYQILICNIAGRVVRNQVLILPDAASSAEIVISVENLPNGIYFVHCRDAASAASLNGRTSKVVLLK